MQLKPTSLLHVSDISTPPDQGSVGNLQARRKQMAAAIHRIQTARRQSAQPKLPRRRALLAEQLFTKTLQTQNYKDSPVTVDAQQHRICKYQDAEELTSSPIPDTMRVSKPIFHSTTRRRPGVQKLAGRGVPTQTDQTTFIMFSMTCNDSLRSRYLQARPTHLSMPQSGEL